MRHPLVVAALALLAAGGPAVAMHTAASEAMGWVSIRDESRLACKRHGDINRMARIFRSGDDTAARRLHDQLQASGSCRSLISGTLVWPEDKDGIWWCARPQGETRCLWMILPEKRLRG